MSFKSQKASICHITSAHKSTDSRIFHKMCTSLSNAGYSVTLVAPGKSRNEKNVCVLGVSVTAKSRLFRMTKLSKAIFKKALTVQADIYHLHDPELLQFALRLKKLGKTVIFDSHEDYVENIKKKHWIPKSLRNLISRAYAQYQNRVLRKVDAVVSVTPHICEKLSQINPNTCMITNFPIVSSQNSSLPSTRTPRTLCFAGGVTPQWMHHNIIPSLKKIGDVKYMLCGPCSEKYLQTLMNIPGWEYVDYRGVIPFDEVPDILSTSTAGMVVSSIENSPNGKAGTIGNTKIFEAMLAGLPVIATDYDIWREYLDPFKCAVWVDPDDPKSIETAIRYIFGHPEEARQMGENGRQAVLTQYNWGNEEKKLLSLYKQLLKEE